MENQDERNERKQGKPEQEFIPGLPNDIVLEHVATKIPWVSMFALTAVSSAWRKAIRSRVIYNMRKRCGAMQVMVAAPVRASIHTGFFDVESQDLYLFPLPPEFLDRVRADLPIDATLYSGPVQGCLLSDKNVYSAKNIVFTNGKLYALQETSYLPWPRKDHQVVFELDVAACDRQWRHCSTCSLHFYYTTIWVACNGKIYAFNTFDLRFHGKVFDPCSYQWAEIKDRPVNVWFPAQTGSRHPIDDDDHLLYHPGRVTVLGTEIYVRFTWGGQMMIFDSVTETWRTVSNTPLNGIQREIDPFSHFCMTAIKGRIYTFSRGLVEVYDPESNSWAEVHRANNLADEGTGMPADVLTVAPSGNELLALLGVDDYHSYMRDTGRKFCKSKGFGTEGEKLVWKDFDSFLFTNCLCGQTDLRLDHLEL